MSIQVGITQKELDEAKELLTTETEIICLDQASHIKYTLVGLELLYAGKTITAKLIPPAKDAPYALVSSARHN